MSFSTKIQNYTNSVSGENVTDSLKRGVDYVLGMVNNANPDMLRLFACEFNLNTSDGEKIKWEDIYKLTYLIDVKSGPRFCRPVTDRMASDLTDTASIYYALDDDPCYYLDSQGYLTIKPAPTSGKGYLYGVVNASGRTIDDTNEKISVTDIPSHSSNFNKEHTFTADEHFPSIFKELVVLHASELILTERLADFRTSIPAGLDNEWSDALAKAKKLFDDGANIQGDNAGASMSVQYWLSDEDEDMSGATIQAISSELGRADRYQTKFKADLEKLATDYQWTQQQLQLITQKKGEFIQVNIKMGPQGSPEQESKI
tara:strand:+ start:34 stop:978 length:945 start_codon:yes stop_codon:yes gene_type:complete